MAYRPQMIKSMMFAYAYMWMHPGSIIYFESIINISIHVQCPISSMKSLDTKNLTSDIVPRKTIHTKCALLRYNSLAFARCTSNLAESCHVCSTSSMKLMNARVSRFRSLRKCSVDDANDDAADEYKPNSRSSLSVPIGRIWNVSSPLFAISSIWCSVHDAYHRIRIKFIINQTHITKIFRNEQTENNQIKKEHKKFRNTRKSSHWKKSV